jgi:DNA-binding NarL/FixJ family response regulator
MSIRLLLIDENVLFRKGLDALLSQQPDFSVIGDLSDGKEAAQVSVSIEPDVVLMDVRLAGSNGLDIAAQIKRHQPQVKIIILTGSRTEEFVRTALRIGIDGYVLKDASLEDLLIAIRSVAKGKKYLSPDVSGHIVESFLYPEQTIGKITQQDILTNRERGILQLIAEGRTNRSVAEFLNVSTKTVEKHRASLMQKLGSRNAAEMTLAAMEMGLIERPSSFARLMGATNMPLDAH